MRLCGHNVLYDPILVFTDEEYCLYPGCRDEKEYYGAQFCSEDHLDQANDEGKLDMPLHSLLRLLLVKEVPNKAILHVSTCTQKIHHMLEDK